MNRETAEFMDRWWRELARRPHGTQAEILAQPAGFLATVFNAEVLTSDPFDPLSACPSAFGTHVRYPAAA